MEPLLRNIPNAYSYKNEYLNHNSKNITKLFLGSSHSYFGVNPVFITGKAFNAANVSQSIDLDYEIIKKYKNNWNKLKYIIIPIDYFTLFSRLSDGGESWRIKNYNLYYDMHLSNKLCDNLEILSINPKSNLRRIISYYLHKSSVTCSRLGFGTNYKKHNDLIGTGKKAALRHTKKDLSELNDNIKILRKIITFANKNNIEVIFYTSPAYKSYVSNLNKKQLDLTITTITKIAKKNKNCYYFNLLEDTDFNSIDFYDADHLINPNGVEKLSLKIDSIINKVRTHNNAYKSLGKWQLN